MPLGCGITLASKVRGDEKEAHMKDYSPHVNAVQAVDPFWLDFWCSEKSEQERILSWIRNGGRKLSSFLQETKILSDFFGEGHV